MKKRFSDIEVAVMKTLFKVVIIEEKVIKLTEIN